MVMEECGYKEGCHFSNCRKGRRITKNVAITEDSAFLGYHAMPMHICFPTF
jgi:hypothetical protein